MIDVDMPEAITVRVRRARKPHTCCECGQLVKSGDLYEDVSGIWNGSPDSHKTCMACVNLRMKLEELLAPHEHAAFGMLHEEAREYGLIVKGGGK